MIAEEIWHHVVCDKCGDKSAKKRGRKVAIITAKNSGWKVSGEKHLCDKCGGGKAKPVMVPISFRDMDGEVTQYRGRLMSVDMSPKGKPTALHVDVRDVVVALRYPELVDAREVGEDENPVLAMLGLDRWFVESEHVDAYMDLIVEASHGV